MKRDAYAYAERGGYSIEIDTLYKIDRFGVGAVMGRNVLYYGEMRRMIVAENIVKSYQSRARAENWAAWVEENTAMANLLAEAENLQNG